MDVCAHVSYGCHYTMNQMPIQKKRFISLSNGQARRTETSPVQGFEDFFFADLQIGYGNAIEFNIRFGPVKYHPTTCFSYITAREAFRVRRKILVISTE